MKNILIGALLTVSFSCQDQASIDAGLPVEEINASILGDQLPADGCGAHLWLNFSSHISSSYHYTRLPTEVTKALMDNVIKAEQAKQPAGTLWMGRKEVTIRYRETGKTASLLCGWNTKQEVKTIELLEIRER